MSTIADNIKSIRETISNKCAFVGVADNQPRLIAVSKVQPRDRVVAALETGHKVFGENRVQEASKRWGDLREAYPDITLILIGGLQTNKAADAVALFDEIQSVDRLKLAKALKKEMVAQGKELPIYLQVNTGEEAQKGGCMPADLPALIEGCNALDLNVVGLMCIPPVGDDPTLHFGLLHKLAGRHNLPKLSMGMSSDYDLAAVMGATDIRVGTGIFGARET